MLVHFLDLRAGTPPLSVEHRKKEVDENEIRKEAAELGIPVATVISRRQRAVQRLQAT